MYHILLAGGPELISKPTRLLVGLSFSCCNIVSAPKNPPSLRLLLSIGKIKERKSTERFEERN